MPVCPRCNATIHPGADDQCPACGYSLRRANAVFGDSLVEFTRVVDAAGALTHQDRMELLHTLEDLERNLAPIALCIYITDDGQAQEFRSHAHWILNHARVHHPSFGKREKMRAIEDAELTERRPGEESRPTEVHPSGLLSRLCQKVRNYVRDAMHPYPPPVKQEWMLILVMDVQLEMACFSWGYMLDPYINPDSINSCIVRARLQFRERAMVSGLKKVMKYAVAQIAANSHRVNKKLRRHLPGTFPLLSLCLGLGLMTSTPVCWAAHDSARNQQRSASSDSKAPRGRTASRRSASSSRSSGTARNSRGTAANRSSASSSRPRAAGQRPAPARGASTSPSVPAPTPAASSPSRGQAGASAATLSLQDDDLAEEVTEDDVPASATSASAATPTPADTPASPPTSPTAGQQASSPSGTPPAAASPPPTPGAPAQYGAVPRWSEEDHRHLMAGKLNSYTLLLPDGKASAARQPDRRPPTARSQESDTSVPGRYCPAYAHPSPAGLCDPQMLLSTVERGDVERFLSQINAHSPFRIYVSLFGAKQEIPQELAATTLVTAVGQPCEYSVMLLYKLGSEPDVELGYQEINPSDDRRHRWQLDVREAARRQGGGLAGLLAAIQQLHESILPLSADFRPITPETAAKAPLIPIVLKEDSGEKKLSLKDKMRLYLEDEQSHPVLIGAGAALLAVASVVLLFIFRRRSGHLYETLPDVRLASPYGAGVSRYVRYLEGKEAHRERSLF